MKKDEYMKRFSYWLRVIMLYKSEKQTALSKETGLSQSAVSAYCCGKKMPSTYSAYKICKALDCSTDVLVNPRPIPEHMYLNEAMDILESRFNHA